LIGVADPDGEMVTVGGDDLAAHLAVIQWTA